MLRINRSWGNNITKVPHTNKDYLKFSAGYSTNHAQGILHCTVQSYFSVKAALILSAALSSYSVITISIFARCNC